MPFYEYECSSCKFYSEVMQKISDPPLSKCPSCGQKALKKLVSAPNFRLKGGGWYETDFKSEQENKRNLHGPDKEEAASKTEPTAKAEGTQAEAASGDSGKAATSEPKAGAKGESKPAAGAKSARPKPAVRPTRSHRKPARGGKTVKRTAAARKKGRR